MPVAITNMTAKISGNGVAGTDSNVATITAFPAEAGRHRFRVSSCAWERRIRPMDPDIPVSSPFNPALHAPARVQ